MEPQRNAFTTSGDNFCLTLFVFPCPLKTHLFFAVSVFHMWNYFWETGAPGFGSFMMVLYERGAQNHKSRHKKSNGRTKVFGPETGWETLQADTSQWMVSLRWKAERKTTFFIKRKLQL